MIGRHYEDRLQEKKKNPGVQKDGKKDSTKYLFFSLSFFSLPLHSTLSPLHPPFNPTQRNANSAYSA